MYGLVDYAQWLVFLSKLMFLLLGCILNAGFIDEMNWIAFRHLGLGADKFMEG